jgi:hypothetical protein
VTERGKMIKITSYRPEDVDFKPTILCPGCGHRGTFEKLGIEDLVINPDLLVGLRRCPNEWCHCLIQFVRNLKATNNELIEVYPFLRIQFDRTGIPEEILSALEEAITCHANGCYVAAAIMIRKTLDLLCLKQGASGSNLKSRISSLRDRILIPDELLQAMDDLRLLGNDAAHIESQDYYQVGKEEVEIAVEFTKEILKAVYQYSALLNRLKSLKK